MKLNKLTLYFIILIILFFLILFGIYSNYKNTDVLYYDGIDLEKHTQKINENNNLAFYQKTATIYNDLGTKGNLLHLVTTNNINNMNQATVQATLYTPEGTLMYFLYHETTKELHRAKAGNIITNIKPVYATGKYANKNINIEINILTNEKETRKVTISY